MYVVLVFGYNTLLALRLLENFNILVINRIIHVSEKETISFVFSFFVLKLTNIYWKHSKIWFFSASLIIRLFLSYSRRLFIGVGQKSNFGRLISDFDKSIFYVDCFTYFVRSPNFRILFFDYSSVSRYHITMNKNQNVITSYISCGTF